MTTPARSATEPLPGESDGWTHPAGTAAGTGYAPDAGHIGNEVAWSVQTEGALTTPVVVDGHLFAAAGFPTDRTDGDTFVDGGLLALDPTDGHERWRTVLPSMGGGFAGCPPTLSSGSLYVGHAGREHFYAVDARTGERRFSFETDNSVNNSIAAAEGNVVFTTSELVYALDETGTEQWSFGTDDETYLPGAPVVAEGVVFVGGATGDPVSAVALDSGDELWSAGPGFHDAAVARETLFARSEGRLTAYDSESGTVRWQVEPPGFGGVSVDDDTVYTTTGERELVAISSENGSVRWRFQVDGDYIGSFGTWPVVTGKTVYTASEQRSAGRNPPVLYALDADSGDPRWSRELPGDSLPPAVHSGRLYLPTYDAENRQGRLYAFE